MSKSETEHIKVYFRTISSPVESMCYNLKGRLLPGRQHIAQVAQSNTS